MSQTQNQKTLLPKNMEFHQRFLSLMAKSGIKSLSELNQKLCLQGDISEPSRLAALSALSYAKTSPFANGQWTGLVQEVCCILNIAPEDLYGFTEDESTKIKSHPLDSDDGHDGWHYNHVTEEWTKDGMDEERINDGRPSFVLITLSEVFEATRTNPTSPLSYLKNIWDTNSNAVDDDLTRRHELTKIRRALTRIGTAAEQKVIFALYGIDLDDTLLGHAEPDTLVKTDIDSLTKELGISPQRLINIKTKYLRIAGLDKDIQNISGFDMS